MQKLKLVKQNIEVWNKEVFGNIRDSKCSISKRIDEMDHFEEGGLMNDTLRLERKELKERFQELVFRGKVLWRQKARVIGLKKEKIILIFFHRVANGKKKRNFIKKLELVDGSETKGGRANSEGKF